MTRRPDPEPPPNPFHDAVCRYADAFPGQGVPYCAKLASGHLPAATAALDGAVKAGRPLAWWGIMKALGYLKAPPIGPDGVLL